MPHPAVELVPALSGRTSVVLAGRATSVPFTAVLTGPERTITGNATRTRPAPFPSSQVTTAPEWLGSRGRHSDAAIELSQAPQLGAQ
jgi:hypothetical protein